MKHAISPFYVLALVLTLIASPAIAQSEKGNGGRVWVCYKPAIDPVSGKPSLEKPEINPNTLLPVIESVQFMDYLEANGTLTRWNIDLGIDHPGVNDVPAMLETAVKRLEQKDRFRAQKLRERLLEIENPAKTNYLELMAKRPGVKIIQDGKYLYSEPVTALCGEKQGAFNISHNLDMEYKYVFIKDYFDAMPDRDKAGIILHEAIYNLEASGYDLHAIKKATRSDGSRKIVQAISSPQIENFSAKRYYHWLKSHTIYPTVSALNGDYREAKFFADSELENYVMAGRLIFKNQSFSKAFLGGEWMPLRVESKPNDSLSFALPPGESVPQPMVNFSYTNIQMPWGSVESQYLRYSPQKPEVLSIDPDFFVETTFDSIETLEADGLFHPFSFGITSVHKRTQLPPLNRHTLQWLAPVDVQVAQSTYRLKYGNELVEIEFKNFRKHGYIRREFSLLIPVRLSFHTNGRVRSLEINYHDDKWGKGIVSTGNLLVKAGGSTREFTFTQKGPKKITLTYRFFVKQLTLEFDEQGNLVKSDFVDLLIKD